MGSILGDADAGVPTLTVFADIASPGYSRFDAEVLPSLLSRYVRPGRIRIQLRTLPGDLPIGAEVARIAQAAGLQTQLWAFVRALAAFNGATTDAGDVAAAESVLKGVDLERLVVDSRSSRVRRAISRASRMASAEDIDATPAFTITDGIRTEEFSAPVSSSGFMAALEQALETLSAPVESVAAPVEPSVEPLAVPAESAPASGEGT